MLFCTFRLIRQHRMCSLAVQNHVVVRQSAYCACVSRNFQPYQDQPLFFTNERANLQSVRAFNYGRDGHGSSWKTFWTTKHDLLNISSKSNVGHKVRVLSSILIKYGKLYGAAVSWALLRAYGAPALTGRLGKRLNDAFSIRSHLW